MTIFRIANVLLVNFLFRVIFPFRKAFFRRIRLKFIQQVQLVECHMGCQKIPL